MFKGWKNWSNMVIVGGAVQACLVDVPAEFKDDLFKCDSKYYYLSLKT